jgi:hypothetical protein
MTRSLAPSASCAWDIAAITLRSTPTRQRHPWARAPVIARCGYCKLPVLESDSRIFDGEQMYHEAHYADAMRGERDELKRLYLVARERVGKGYGFTSPQFVALPHPDSLRGQ